MKNLKNTISEIYNNPYAQKFAIDPLKTFGAYKLQQLLHSKYPSDFEYYLLALEIRDYDAPLAGKRIKNSLIFPVNPERIFMLEKKLSKITKTFKGVVINEIESFVPFSINISGTFGRKFRVLFGSKIGGYVTDDVEYQKLSNATTVKTGYGVLKELQNLFKMSRKSNQNGRPYRTILYNLMFSSIYLVELQDLKITQSQDKNRLWYYDLQMMVVSPFVAEFQDLGHYNKIMTYDAISKGMNKMLDSFNFTLNSLVSTI